MPILFKFKQMSSMEEILVNINYLIREKLWGSIRILADKVG